MPILAIDIGNTHTHFGIVSADGVQSADSMPTGELRSKANALVELIGSPDFATHRIEGLAFCSVVPKQTPGLVAFARSFLPGKPAFQLTHEADLGIPVTYPIPSQIGQDRLANVAAAQSLYGAPAIIIDMGTAVTLDVITRTMGYEGGVIAPGIDLLRRTLHEQTALLPSLETDFRLGSSIGRSTTEAMQIGCLIGFRGMVGSLVEAIRSELETRGEEQIHLIATGGASALLNSRDDSGITFSPNLTLRGLFEAFCLNEAPAKGP
ncbi:MAG: type III pantothenate kinase [Verrucomicrobia bacterium]|nr:MAG: type III pantothenate kinase [Verrucomicrobiota bacterium]